MLSDQGRLSNFYIGVLMHQDVGAAVTLLNFTGEVNWTPA